MRAYVKIAKWVTDHEGAPNEVLKARYTNSIKDAFRQTFDVGAWVDTSFLDQVVKEEHLEDYWPPRPVL